MSVKQQPEASFEDMDAVMRASEIRYRGLFEAACDGILILDPESGKVVNANPFLYTLLGYRGLMI